LPLALMPAVTEDQRKPRGRVVVILLIVDKSIKGFFASDGNAARPVPRSDYGVESGHKVCKFLYTWGC